MDVKPFSPQGQSRNDQRPAAPVYNQKPAAEVEKAGSVIEDIKKPESTPTIEAPSSELGSTEPAPTIEAPSPELVSTEPTPAQSDDPLLGGANITTETDGGLNFGSIAEATADTSGQPLFDKINIAKDKEKSKATFKKIKKPLIISLCAIVLLGGLFALYAVFVGFDKLAWDEAYGDLALEYVMQSKVKLGVDFNQEKLDQLEINTTCGEFTQKNTKIVWDLSTADKNECEISVKYKLHNINKKYKIINNSVVTYQDINNLVLDSGIDFESDENDDDHDGLSNKKEKELGTDPLIEDSDLDGLNDKEEGEVYKTDPTKEDTDGDGINDGNEIVLGLDPTKTDSKGDGTNDGDRELSIDLNVNGVKMRVLGKGNIAETNIRVQKGSKISNHAGLIDNLYSFETNGKLDSAIVVIPYTMADLAAAGVNEDNLKLYNYNVETDKYEAIETVVDKKKKTITANLGHFSYYVLGDSTKVSEKIRSDALIVLDNSWSMYSKEDYMRLTGDAATDDLDNDPTGQRFTLSSQLAEKLNAKNFRVGISEFREDYANVLPIGSPIDEIKTKLSGMNGTFATSEPGTNVQNALKQAIASFNDNNSEHIIIVLTDGQDNHGFRRQSDTDAVIKLATDKNVKICAIGFGGSTYHEALQYTAKYTGCDLYSSTDANGLDETFKHIESEINNNLIDIDNDDKTDALVLADSGFVASRDGFSFANYGTTKAGGHCYGMATFAELYYTGKLPLKSEGYKFGENESKSYNLGLVRTANGTYLDKYINLYDFRFTSEPLKYVLGFDYFGQETPADLYTVKDDKLIYNDKYAKDIKKADIYKESTEETHLSKEKQLEKHGVNYSTYQDFQLDEDKITDYGDSIEYGDRQMFSAIYGMYIKQNDQNVISSGSSLIWDYRTNNSYERSSSSAPNVFLERLTERIASGDPVTISFNYAGAHAVNAISLAQDIKDFSTYYIGIYDNNFPGETHYAKIKCNKKACKMKDSEWYSNYDSHLLDTGTVIRMTTSLDYDLEVLKNHSAK